MRSKQKKQKQGMILGRIASIYILLNAYTSIRQIKALVVNRFTVV